MDVRKTKTIYFARPKTQYSYLNMKEQLLHTAALNAVGWPRYYQIIDPDDPMLARAYNDLKGLGHPDSFQVFTLLATSADHILAATFQDGAMGAGVANEIAAYFNWRSASTKPRVWITTAEKRDRQYVFPEFTVHEDFNSVRRTYDILTIPQTREYIKRGAI